MSLLFTLAILAALAAVVWKKGARRRALAALDEENASKTERVIEVAGFDAVDARVAAERCGCGGRLKTISEGPAGELFVVDVRCARCGARVRLRFRLPAHAVH